MTRPLTLTGGTLVTPDGTLSEGALTIVDDAIEAVSAPTRPPAVGTTVDVSGTYVLPGLVDIHGDDIERYLYPRPEERIPVASALRQSERAALAAGVTTKFHAVAFEDAPDERRSVQHAAALTDAIDGRRDAAIDTRVHARCEVGEAAAVAAVVDLLAGDRAGLVSLMNHLPGEGQYTSADGFSNRYETGTDGGLQDVIRSRATVAASTLAQRREAVVAAADRADVPVASHDDEDAAAVEAAADDGVDICEFPLTMAAARRASERGLTVAMGAPNLVRGGSLWENLDARAALEAGLVDVFCSDFRPQTLLEVAFADTDEPIHRRVERVTHGPARAVGLTDRGRLEPGARADVVVVDPDPTPTVTRVFVAGREVYRFDTDERYSNN